MADRGGPVVVKVGGGEGVDLGAVAADVAALHAEGAEVVLVHGGSHETNLLANALGRPPEFITSPSGHTSRRTDRRTLEIFEMVYCGKINKGLVEDLQRRGVNAVGLSGVDGRLWEGPRKTAVRAVDAEGRTTVIRDDLTGRVEHVNTTLLSTLRGAGFVPVLTPPAISFDGQAMNVDADRAAAMTAAAIGAGTLVLLSNVPGLLERFPDPSSLLPRITPDDMPRAEAAAEGRMKKKVLAAQEALAGGVERVVIGDSRRDGPISAALTGAGTVFTR